MQVLGRKHRWRCSGNSEVNVKKKLKTVLVVPAGAPELQDAKVPLS